MTVCERPQQLKGGWFNTISTRQNLRTCMQVKKQQLEPDMEQWTGSKLGKEYVKAVYLTVLI